MENNNQTNGRHPEIVVVSQLVQDIRLHGGDRREELARSLGLLRGGLREKNLLPNEEKITGKFSPMGYKADEAVLVVDVHGLEGSDKHNRLDHHIFHPFPLPFKAPPGQMMSNSASGELGRIIQEYCADVTIEDGGNTQNMALNLCLASFCDAYRDRYHVTILSSSDPFKRLSPELQEQLRAKHSFHPIDNLPDRLAIQAPCREGAKMSQISLTSLPLRTEEYLAPMLKAREEMRQVFRNGTLFLASDPLIGFVKSQARAERWYTIMINASTAYRTFVANTAFGVDAILPMNQEEAGDVARVLAQQGKDKELHDIQSVNFPSPFTTEGGSVHESSLRELDDVLKKLSIYNPRHAPSSGRFAFNYPITFGDEGGLLVGSTENRDIVCFTSIVHPDKMSPLLEKYASTDRVKKDGLHIVGAGDSAASIVALCNACCPTVFILSHMEGRERDNANLLHYASTVFVSALSRIAGAFLTRTEKTYWDNIDMSKFDALLQEVGKESLTVARQMVKSGGAYRTGTLKPWGINTVLWKLGEIARQDVDEQSS